MPKVSITLNVNGESRTVAVWPMARLLDVLRENFGLTGTKEGCGEGECGACSVLLDGELVNSCLVPALEAGGNEVVTIEGIAARPEWDALRYAFVSSGGAQCGICTPGMIMAAANLIDSNPEPSDAEIRRALAGNLCRCTGYTRILEAVAAAARLRSTGEPRA